MPAFCAIHTYAFTAVSPTTSNILPPLATSLTVPSIFSASALRFCGGDWWYHGCLGIAAAYGMRLGSSTGGFSPFSVLLLIIAFPTDSPPCSAGAGRTDFVFFRFGVLLHLQTLRAPRLPANTRHRYYRRDVVTVDLRWLCGIADWCAAGGA